MVNTNGLPSSLRTIEATEYLREMAGERKTDLLITPESMTTEETVNVKLMNYIRMQMVSAIQGKYGKNGIRGRNRGGIEHWKRKLLKIPVQTVTIPPGPGGKEESSKHMIGVVLADGGRKDNKWAIVSYYLRPRLVKESTEEYEHRVDEFVT